MRPKNLSKGQAQIITTLTLFVVAGINSSQDILNLLLFTSDQMADYGEGSPLVTDDNALLEFFTARYTLSSNPNEVFLDITRFLGAANG